MAATLRFEIDQAAIEALASTPGQPIHQWWTITLAQIDARAKEYLSGSMVNVRTGNLRSSQQSHVETAGGLIIGVAENIAEYAVAVHEGTAPHDIRPRRGKVLTGWTFNGQPVFTPVVHHPGTKARPFLATAMNLVIRDLIPSAYITGAL